MKTLNTSCVLAVCMAVSPTFSYAQSSCAAVYADSTRNIDAVSKQASEYSYMYSTHCESNGSLRNSSSGQDLSIAYAGIEVGWKGTKAEAEQKMRDFCKSRQSEYNKASSYLAVSNNVVTEALKSFNQCKALELKSVFMSHYADQTSLIIRGDLNPTTTRVSVQAVLYDETLGVCQSTSIRPPKPIRVTATMNAFTAKGPFSITCKRLGFKTQTGEIKYPRFEVSVATNHGTYGVTLLAEDILSFDIASQNRQELAKRDAAIFAVNQQLDLEKQKGDILKKRIEGVTVTSHQVYENQNSKDAWCYGANDFMQRTCGAGKVIGKKLVFDVPGGSCGARQHLFSCLNIPE
jgi:hypothetical protein